MKNKLLLLGFSSIVGLPAFAQNAPDSIHIRINENNNGVVRVLDTIVAAENGPQLFMWMEAQGFQTPPPPPPPPGHPMEFETEIIIEGDSGTPPPNGQRRVMVMKHADGDSLAPLPPPPPGGKMIMIEENGSGPRQPHPPHPPRAPMEITVIEKDTVINGKPQKIITRTEKIIAPPPPPAPPAKPGKTVPPKTDNSLTVYPNPASSVITVEFDVIGKQKTTLRVVDMNGKAVYTEVIAEDQSQHLKREINLSGKGKGAYTVEIDNGTKVIAERVILQ